MNKTTITAEPGMPQITITREFDAPRELVFRAHTDPELLVQWLGPRDLTLTIDRYEARDGGTWRYVHADAQGREYGFHGVFHGTPSPDAIVQTFESVSYTHLDVYKRQLLRLRVEPLLG